MTPQPEHDPQRRPRVSVIMPTYAHERIIEHSIESVLAQDYSSYELIVIDDESPDDTGAVVAKYGEPVRYIRQKNQGLPGARNTGMRAARGEIIALLDGDDLYEPNYLSTMVRALDADPAADAVYCRSRFVDMENRPLPQLTGAAVPPEDLHDALLRGNFLTPNCIVAHARCYRDVGLFDMAIQKGEWDMWLQFARRFRVIGIDDVLGRYRVVPQSMSSANPLPMLEAQLQVLRKHFGQETADVSQWQDAHKAAYWRTHILTATEFMQAGKLDEAFQLLQDSLNGHPAFAQDLEVFYELAVGGQPRGYRGDFSSWDMEGCARTLIRLLGRIFEHPQTVDAVKRQKDAAYATAHLALGLICYGAGRQADARRFLLQSIRFDPGFLLRKELNRALLRSLLPSRSLAALRAWRRELSSRTARSGQPLET